jgi:hypothetical protein
LAEEDVEAAAAAAGAEVSDERVAAALAVEPVAVGAKDLASGDVEAAAEPEVGVAAAVAVRTAGVAVPAGTAGTVMAEAPLAAGEAPARTLPAPLP